VISEKKIKNKHKGPLWSLAYGSWTYNFICNQYLSPLMLWLRIPYQTRCTRYNIMR